MTTTIDTVFSTTRELDLDQNLTIWEISIGLPMDKIYFGLNSVQFKIGN